MAVTRTRGRRSGAGKALMLRREFVADVEALKLDWRAWWGSCAGTPWMDKAAADVLTREPAPGTISRWYNPARLDEWQDEGRVLFAAQANMGPVLDAQAWRAHRDVHSGRRIPEHMTGGCGDGPVSPASPWLPRNGERFDVPVSGGADGWGLLGTDDEKRWAAIEQAYAEEGESWGRLSPHPDITPLDPDWEPGMPPAPPHVAGDGDDPRPELDETRVDVIPSGTYELPVPQPPGRREQS
jgi:hypothetical protein